ncbi:MAG: alpha/beta hydrolase [Pseudonocardia sp.]|nr:alpha/beta hydrolase [Pseudonocardia sp.]
MSTTESMSETAGAARQRLLGDVPVTQRRLDLAGVSTAVLDGGDGPPMILLHGPGEFAETWWRVLPGLMRTHRVIAPDLPGHGASVVRDGTLDVQRVIGWLAGLVEQTCAAPPVLVGRTLGGAIAARFAAAHGDRVERLVLVDSFGLAPFQPAPQFGQVLHEFLADPTRHTYEGLMRYCSFDVDRLHADSRAWEALVAYAVDRAATPSVQAAMTALITEFGTAIPPADLDRIPIPTSLIWGRHDLATALSVAEQASARHGWPLSVIENAADDPSLDQPEAFLDALRAR